MKFFAALLTITAATAATAAVISPPVTTNAVGAGHVHSLELVPRGKTEKAAGAWSKVRGAFTSEKAKQKKAYDNKVAKKQAEIDSEPEPIFSNILKKELEIIQFKGPYYKPKSGEERPKKLDDLINELGQLAQAGTKELKMRERNSLKGGRK